MAEVRNAADPEQVFSARRHEKRQREARRAVYRQQLASPHGRAFCWHQLEDLGVFRSVLDDGLDRVLYQAGRQDAGHRLMADLIAVDEKMYELMEREARERARLQSAENEAAHTPSATDGAMA